MTVQLQAAGGLPRPIRLGAYAPSPVYYRSGLYRRIATDPRVELTAMFSSSAGVRLGDLGFGRPVSFDADALSGFSSVFLRRADRTEPGSSFTSLFDMDVILETVRRRFDVLWLHGYYSPTHLMAAATQIVLGRRLLVREEQTAIDHAACVEEGAQEAVAPSPFLPLTRALHRKEQSAVVSPLRDARRTTVPRPVLR